VETQRVSAYARLRALFERFADLLSTAIGTPPAFMLALAIVIIWAVLGPAAGFSNTWQLIINTGTTIVTFLMVFLLANSSNRITENQEEMLSRIYGQEEQLDAEERLIKKVLERIDRQHIRPILNHLDDQDRAMETVVVRILEAVSNLGPPSVQPK
jgi:low affinity Fe/Cu permease